MNGSFMIDIIDLTILRSDFETLVGQRLPLLHIKFRLKLDDRLLTPDWPADVHPSQIVKSLPTIALLPS